MHREESLISKNSMTLNKGSTKFNQAMSEQQNKTSKQILKAYF